MLPAVLFGQNKRTAKSNTSRNVGTAPADRPNRSQLDRLKAEAMTAIEARTVQAQQINDMLFSFSVGGMRPFGALAMEMIGMGAPYIRGVVSVGNVPYVVPLRVLSQMAMMPERRWSSATVSAAFR